MKEFAWVDPGQCDLQRSTQTRELSKNVWINTYKGTWERVKTGSIRAMKEQEWNERTQGCRLRPAGINVPNLAMNLLSKIFLST